MTAGYFRTSSRLAAVSTRSQHAATRSDGSCDAARSTASAILRTIPRAAAPRSSRPFQISMRIRSRWRRSSRHTSTDGDGFAGRVGSSKRPVQPFGEPKAEFLRYEMACVARPRICDVAVEADRQRPVERNADRNPRCNRHALPVTSLEVTDLRLAQTDPPPEHSLRKSSSVSSRPRIFSQRRGDRLRFSSPRDLCCGSLPSGHIDTIVTDGSAPAIGGRSTRNCGISGSRQDGAAHT
jgi:hypothetical protein